MKMLDLFSGIGGISLAAEWAGIETIAFCEIEPFCQKILQKHWPEVPIFEDVKKLNRQVLIDSGVIKDGETIDIVCGGYPCQPFSYAGNRRGEEDDRHLWPHVKELLQEIRPRWFIGENVAGHVTLGLDTVLSDLESIGYSTQSFIIPAVAVNAPHRRDRVFIVGYTEHHGSSSTEIGRSINKTGHNNSQRPDETSEFEGTSEFENNAAMEDSTSLQCDTRTEEQGVLREVSANGSECDNSNGSSETQSREVMADSTGRRQSGSGEPINTSHSEEDGEGKTSDVEHVCVGAERPTKSRLGGMSNGISTRLDGHKWPSFLGQDQYEWEPPRVANGVKDRQDRLKALGNAVVPQQIYPIFEAIMKIG